MPNQSTIPIPLTPQRRLNALLGQWFDGAEGIQWAGRVAQLLDEARRVGRRWLHGRRRYAQAFTRDLPPGCTSVDVVRSHPP